jgi:hypothetical protein
MHRETETQVGLRAEDQHARFVQSYFDLLQNRAGGYGLPTSLTDPPLAPDRVFLTMPLRLLGPEPEQNRQISSMPWNTTRRPPI